jgi:hypothetical protein
MSDITVDTDGRSTLRLLDQIDVLAMSGPQSRRLMKAMGKEIRQDLRRNIRGQRTVSGSKMPPRARKLKKKMFRKMGTGIETQIQNNHQAEVTWKQSGQAKIAFRHHHGVPENFTARKAARIYGIPDYKKPATPAQARALNKEGFRRRVARKKGKGGAVLKRVPARWILENMSRGQAGMILRLMRTGSGKGKQSWTVKVPERPILGATPQDAQKYLTAMATEALAKIRTI